MVKRNKKFYMPLTIKEKLFKKIIGTIQLVTLIGFLVGIGVEFYLYQNNVSHNLKEVKDRVLTKLTTIAKTSAILLDGKAHDEIFEYYDYERESFFKLKKQLLQIKSVNSIKSVLYTLRLEDKEKLLANFVIMTDLDKKTKLPYIGNSYKFPKEMLQSFTKGKFIYTNIYRSSSIGNKKYMSVFAPFKEGKNTNFAVLEVDIEMDDLLSIMKIENKKTLFLHLARLLSLFTLLFFIQFLIKTKVIESVIEIVNTPLEAFLGHLIAIENFSKINFLRLNTNDEFEVLAKGFNDMVQKISESHEVLQKSNSDLLIALEQAKVADKAKSKFLAIMSHEIRTPLNGVLGLTEQVLDTNLTLEQQDLLNTVQESGNTLLVILNDILDFSKLDAKQLKLDLREFNLNILLSQIVKLYEKQIQQNQIYLIFNHLKNFNQELIGDPDRLRQILMNLTSNAIKFTSNGEVELKIDIIEDKKESMKIKFSVRDTGIGISQENQTKLFKTFSQVDDSHSRQYGGTGLGLSIALSLVEQMGGNILVDSTEGIGSTFYFTIELKKSKQIVKEKDSLKDEKFEKLIQKLKQYKDKRILVAEDNKVNQKVVTRFFKKIGFKNISLVENGRMAVEKFKLYSYDIILMDCQMPGMDGFEATTKIRELEKKQNILKPVPIIAQTAHVFMNDEIINCGMNDLITKPLGKQKLTELLLKWFHKKTNETIVNGSKNISSSDQKIIDDLALYTDKKILVAEDDKTNQKVMSGLLNKLNFTHVDFVDFGEKAVEAYDFGDYDLILMDCLMPNMTGFEATQNIRLIEKDLQIKNPIPIIAQTAHIFEDEEIKKVEMSDIITKPISLKSLSESLSKWLAKLNHQNKNKINYIEKLEKYRHKKILIAEDNKIDQIIISGLFEKFNFTNIDLVNSGTKAVEAFDFESYDLVLMDCQMPEMSGFEASQHIREIEKDHDSTQNIPIIAQTAFIFGDEEIKKAGMTDIIFKPLTKKKLAEILIKYFSYNLIIDSQANKSTSKKEYLDMFSKYSHKKILIVEDNKINQKVILGLVKKFGFFNIDLAINGEEAIYLYKSNFHDIILMDCQMPIMDGFEATQQIRQIESDLQKKPAPIIAQTAHIFKDGEVLKAGMNDQISKPLNKKKLSTVLLKWLKKSNKD